MAETRPRSLAFAKGFLETAMKTDLIKSNITVRELISIIPSSGDVNVAGGVLAWSGYVLVYPSVADQLSD